MRDVNTSILKAYYAALSGITYNSLPIPVYSSSLPDNINPNNYIVFGEISNNDLSSKHSADTSTTIRVTIHTFDEKYSSPIVANDIAGQVFDRLYTDSHFALTLTDDFQIYSTELFADTTNAVTMDANRAFIDRTLTFRHKIYHREPLAGS